MLIIGPSGTFRLLPALLLPSGLVLAQAPHWLTIRWIKSQFGFIPISANVNPIRFSPKWNVLCNRLYSSSLDRVVRVEMANSTLNKFIPKKNVLYLVYRDIASATKFSAPLTWVRSSCDWNCSKKACHFVTRCVIPPLRLFKEVDAMLSDWTLTAFLEFRMKCFVFRTPNTTAKYSLSKFE